MVVSRCRLSIPFVWKFYWQTNLPLVDVTSLAHLYQRHISRPIQEYVELEDGVWKHRLSRIFHCTILFSNVYFYEIYINKFSYNLQNMHIFQTKGHSS